jgi:hypothetical protein
MRRREFIFMPAAAAAQPAVAQPGPARREAHPRLFFGPTDIGRLRQRIERDVPFRESWAGLLESARRLLDAAFISEEVAARGGGQHANYGQPANQISSMGSTLGLAYHVAGERQYAAKLRDAMLHYARYQRWNGPGQAGRSPQWKSELNGAGFCFGFGAGFDAIREFLTAEERQTIVAAMVRLGIRPALEDWVLPATRIHALDSMGHNWWAVCVSNAGVACLAILDDEPRAAVWVDRTADNLAQWFGYRGNVLQNKSATFDRDGAFYEGAGYANYALSEYLRFRLAYANVVPGHSQPRVKPLEQATDFFLQTLYPTSSGFYTVNFGDSGLHNSSAATVRLLVETGFRHPNSGWYLSKTGTTGPLAADPLALLARQPQPPPTPPDSLPRSCIYRDVGWAMLRDSWRDDATMLGVKCGFTWNHSHADAGSFVLFHKGAPLITDSGTVNYADPLYRGYYVTSHAHNVVLFNGEGQPAEDIGRGVKFPGRMYSLLDGAGLKYVYADATGPMARWFTRAYRHWLWLDGAILVFDDLRAFEPGRFDWLLHHDGASAALDGNRVTLSAGNSKADLRFLFPADLDVREEMGYADHQPEQKAPYSVFSNKAPSRDEKFLAAILPYPDRGAIPLVEPLSSADAIGVRVSQGEAVTDVWLNLRADGRKMHDNSINRISGWDTDAYLLALTRARDASTDTRNVSRYFVADGSFLRNSGHVALDVLAKQTCVWRPGEKMLTAEE